MPLLESDNNIRYCIQRYTYTTDKQTKNMPTTYESEMRNASDADNKNEISPHPAQSIWIYRYVSCT